MDGDTCWEGLICALLDESVDLLGLVGHCVLAWVEVDGFLSVSCSVFDDCEGCVGFDDRVVEEDALSDLVIRCLAVFACW